MLHRFLALLLALAPSVSIAQPLPYGLDPSKLTLDAPPAPDSRQGQYEYELLKLLQTARTQAQCDAAAAQKFKLLPALFFTGGDLAPAEHLPVFTEALQRWVELSMQLTEPFQKRFARKRPSDQYPDLEPCLDKPKTESYPSSHAATAALLALNLSLFYPEKAAAFFALAERISQNRVLGGVHFLSDVNAGAELAVQAWMQLNALPEFHAEGERIRAALAKLPQ